MCPHAQMIEDRTIRCTLAHDMVWLRQGLRRLLEDEPDIAVVAEAGSADEALRSVVEHRPEVAIVNWHLFEDSAPRAESLILQESPNSKVVFLGTMEEDAPQGVNASCCAVRGTSAGELVQMVRTAAGREPEPVPSIGSTVREFIPRNRILTAREREVLKLLAEGKTVRSVASMLGLSIKTVDAHKFNLMRKLGIHNKAELVMWAIQKKMVKVPVNF